MQQRRKANANPDLEQVTYLVRHVNFGSDDGTPSSKFEIDFTCGNRTQARAIFDLVVARTGYKPTRLVLSSQQPVHLPHISALSYEDALPNLSGIPLANKDSAKGVLIDSLKNQPVTVHRGRTSGFKGHATGYGYLAAIPASAKRVFLFHKDKTAIGPATAIKQELVLEVLVGPDSKWYSGKYVNILDNPTSWRFLEGIIAALDQYMVSCPHCIASGLFKSEKCFVEKLVREMNVESKCTRCQRSFFITLFS